MNHLRALCLLANVYSRVGPASEAVSFARQTVALSEQEPDGQTAFDRATAYECLSRALTASGATEEARCVRQRAIELAGLIEDSEERVVFGKLSFGDWRG